MQKSHFIMWLFYCVFYSLNRLVLHPTVWHSRNLSCSQWFLSCVVCKRHCTSTLFLLESVHSASRWRIQASCDFLSVFLCAVFNFALNADNSYSGLHQHSHRFYWYSKYHHKYYEHYHSYQHRPWLFRNTKRQKLFFSYSSSLSFGQLLLVCKYKNKSKGKLTFYLS